VSLTDEASSPAVPQPGTLQIFTAFAIIGLSSLGGGLSGWMMREFVQKRRWITDREFFSGLALAQAFPGVNVVNLAIWIGFRLHGGPGALVAAAGIIVPPMFLAIGVLSFFEYFTRYPLVGVLLAGVVAAAIGLSLAMGARAVRAVGWQPVPLLVMAATIFALLIMQWPLVPVLLVTAPISIGLAFWQLRPRA
jgi:chromate transporter